MRQDYVQSVQVVQSIDVQDYQGRPAGRENQDARQGHRQHDPQEIAEAQRLARDWEP